MNPASPPPPDPSLPPAPISPPRTHPARSLLHGLLIAGGYFLMARASFSFADSQPNTSPVWPPAGLAMAMLFLAGRRYAPAVFVGAALTNLDTLCHDPAAPPPALILCSLGTALGNTAEALLAAWALEHRASSRQFCLSSLGASRFVTNVALLPPLLTLSAKADRCSRSASSTVILLSPVAMLAVTRLRCSYSHSLSRVLATLTCAVPRLCQTCFPAR